MSHATQAVRIAGRRDRYRGGYRPDRFFANCSCGWQGFTRTSREEAEAEGKRHRENPEVPNP